MNLDDVQHRMTPENITSLKDNEIFVFGSNLSGRHGAGAAKTARKWGAIYGQSCGMQGKTYGIPTVNAQVTKNLPPHLIEDYVEDFIDYAEEHPEFTFLVTKIGCGLAGLTIPEIAPMFHRTKTLENVWLPLEFWQNLLADEEVHVPSDLEEVKQFVKAMKEYYTHKTGPDSALTKHVISVEGNLGKIEEALKFYADSKNYFPRGILITAQQNGYKLPPIYGELGELARQVTGIKDEL